MTSKYCPYNITKRGRRHGPHRWKVMKVAQYPSNYIPFAYKMVLQCADCHARAQLVISCQDGQIRWDPEDTTLDRRDITHRQMAVLTTDALFRLVEQFGEQGETSDLKELELN